MKQYFNFFFKSLYDFKWLGLQRFSWRLALSYFAIFNLVISLILSLFLFSDFKNFLNIKNKILINLNNVSDFSLTFNGSELNFSNLPPRIVLDEDLELIFYSKKNKQILDKINSEKLLIIIKNNGFNLRNKDNDEFYPWNKIFKNKFSLSKADIISWLENKLLFFLIVISLFSLVVIYIISFLSNLIILYFISIFAWIFAKLDNNKWQLKEIFNISLFACTLPLLIVTVLRYFDIYIQYFFSASVLFYLLIIIFKFDFRKIKLKNK